MTPLPEKLKRAAEDAFHDNGKLGVMSPEEREQAAQWYQAQAAEVKGPYEDLARLYNLERAKFLRGQVSRIAGRAHDFGREIGYPDAKGVI